MIKHPNNSPKIVSTTDSYGFYCKHCRCRIEDWCARCLERLRKDEAKKTD